MNIKRKSCKLLEFNFPYKNRGKSGNNVLSTWHLSNFARKSDLIELIFSFSIVCRYMGSFMQTTIERNSWGSLDYNIAGVINYP